MYSQPAFAKSSPNILDERQPQPPVPPPRSSNRGRSAPTLQHVTPSDEEQQESVTGKRPETSSQTLQIPHGIVTPVKSVTDDLFLEKSMFVSKTVESGPDVTAKSPSGDDQAPSILAQSPVSPNSGEIIRFQFVVNVHSGAAVTQYPIKRFSCRSDCTFQYALEEVCSYADSDTLKPMYVHCRTTDTRIEETTTIAEVSIDSATIFDFHAFRVDEGRQTMARRRRRTKTSTSSTSTFSLPDPPESVEMTTGALQANTTYLCALIFNQDRQLLCAPNNILPTFPIIDSADVAENLTQQSKEFQWAKQRSMDWEKSAHDTGDSATPDAFVYQSAALIRQQCQYLAALQSPQQSPLPVQHLSGVSEKLSTQFKVGFLGAACALRRTLGLSRFGYLYPSPVHVSTVPGVRVLVTVQFCSHDFDADIMQQYGLKWRPVRGLHPGYHNVADDSIWANYLQFYQSQKMTLAPGIYVGAFHVRHSLDSMDILVPRHHPDLLPLCRVNRPEARRKFGTRSSSSLPSPTSPVGSAAVSTGSRRSDISDHQPQPQQQQQPSPLPTHSNHLQLSEKEWEYLALLANPTKEQFDEFMTNYTITPALEQFGKDTMHAISELRDRMGLTSDLDIARLSMLGPVILEGGVTILVLDLQNMVLNLTQSGGDGGDLTGGNSSGSSSKPSIFTRMARIAGARPATPEENEVPPPQADSKDSSSTSTVDDKLFTFVPLSLFESLHHHSYNNAAYTKYRRAVDTLQLTHLGICNRSSHSRSDSSGSGGSASGSNIKAMQKVMDEVHRLRKEWNANYSWTIKLIQAERKRATAHMHVF